MNPISIKNLLRFAFLATLVAAPTSCLKRQAVAISDVCLEDNETIVRITGFLRRSSGSPGDESGSTLLVENSNGTGRFIEVQFDHQIADTLNREVAIKGKILKKENSCLVKAEIIENP